MQFADVLQRRGITVDFSPLFDDDYLRAYYAGGSARPMMAWIKAGLRRLAAMLGTGRYDAVWLEKEAFPFVPWIVEGPLLRQLPPFIADYDDAIFHNYDQSGNAMVRKLFSRKIGAVMARAFAVTAGNDYLAAYARAAGATNVEIIPTVLDPARYGNQNLAASDKRFRIGWIGTKSTAAFLKTIAAVLARAQKELDAEIVIIGASGLDLPGVVPIYRPWSEDTEAQLLSDLTVGIMPLIDGPWERGKCGYKILQYMASRLPAIASPVGANTEIVVEGTTGFLASDEDQWFARLQWLRQNADAAKLMGLAGRKRVEESYSIAAVEAKMAGLLHAAAQSRGKQAR